MIKVKLFTHGLLSIFIVGLLTKTNCAQINTERASHKTLQSNCTDSKIEGYIERLSNFRPGDIETGMDNKNYDGSFDADAYQKLVDCGERSVPKLIAELTMQSIMGYANEPYNAVVGRALGQIGSDAVPTLISIIQNPNEVYPFNNVHLSAIFALGAIGSEASEAIPVLVRAFEEKQGEYELPTRAFIFALSEMGAEAVPTLIQLLQTNDTKKQSLATYALGNIGSAAYNATPVLLKQSDFGAAYTLSKIGTASSIIVPFLIKIIHQTDRDYIAVTSLRHYGFSAQESAPVLGDILEVYLESKTIYGFKDNAIICDAVTALGKMGQKGKLQLDALYQNHDDIRIKVLAAHGLVNFYEEVPPLLVENLHVWGNLSPEECFNMRHTALGFSDRAIPALLAALNENNEELQIFAIYGLGNVDNPNSEVVYKLIQKLKDKNPTIRLASVEALGSIGKAARSASDALFAALQDTDEEVRREAAIALFKVNSANPRVADGVLEGFNTGASGEKVSRAIARTWSER